MSDRSANWLVEEYQRLAEHHCQQNEDETGRLLHLHLHLTQQPDHPELLYYSLQQGRKGSELQLLVCAHHLAYLTNFTSPQDQLEEERRLYMNSLASGLLYSREARQAYAMLAEEECEEMLNQVKQRIQDQTSVSDLRDVQVMLQVLREKVAWEEKKQRLTRTKPSPLLYPFLDQLIAFLTNTRYSQKEEVLREVACLTSQVLSFLGKEQAGAYRSMIIPLMEHWLSLKIFKKEVQLDVLKAITASISVYGLFRTDLFYQFFSTNLGLLEDQQYLHLLAAFLERLDSGQRLNQSQLTKVLKGLFSGVLCGTRYQYKSLMVQQILKISRVCSCQLSKHLSQYFSEAATPSHQALMGALMLVFDQRISAETVNTIEHHKLRYLEKSKQTVLCEEVLWRYCQEQMDWEDLILNPEHADDIMWELLLLRTIVAVNYGLLCEINRIVTLLRNLLTLTLLGVFPQECLDILERVLAQHQLYSLHDLTNFSFATLLTNIVSVLNSQTQNQLSSDQHKFTHLFRNFRKAVNMITSKQRVVELEGLSLFQAVLRLSNELPERFATAEMRKEQSLLLEAVLPSGLQAVGQEEMKRCMQEVVLHMRKTGSSAAFILYLELMGRSLQHPELTQLFLELNLEVEAFLHSSRVATSLEDSYKIHFFVLTGRPYQQKVLENCWNMLFRLGSLQSTQFCFHILTLFRYFARWVAQNCPEYEADFLRYQLGQGEQVAAIIEELVGKTEILGRLEQLLALRQAQLMFLQETLWRYGELGRAPCQQLSRVSSFLLSAYHDIKVEKELANMKCRPKIAQYWCVIESFIQNGQLLVLVMAAWVMEGQQWEAEHHLVGNLMDIDEKFEWVSKIYPKGHKQELLQLSLCFNCQLFQLKHHVKRTLLTQQ